MSIVVWIVSGIAALAFIAAGGMKLARPKAALEPQMGWVADFSAWQVKAIGALEVLGGLGLILPVLLGIAAILTPIAAIGLVIIMVGAMVVHVRRKETVVPNLVLAALAAFIAITRLMGF